MREFEEFRKTRKTRKTNSWADRKAAAGWVLLVGPLVLRAIGVS